MITTLKELVTENILLKVFSLLIGYTLWFTLSQSHYTKIQCDVPVAVYQAPQHKKINAPDKVRITLAGKKSELQDINFHDLAVHINGENLHDGNNPQNLSQTTLFLPDHIKLVHYTPVEINIVVT